MWMTLAAMLLFAVGCGSSSMQAPAGGPDAGPDGGSNAGPTAFKLSIHNVLDWCDITVDGTTSHATSPPDKTYAPGTVVHLIGAPTSSSFIWGYWTGTDGATGSPARETKTHTTVTLSADKNVTVGCPFPDGSGC